MLSLFVSSNSLGQTIRWNQRFGGDEQDAMTNLITTQDGGYAMVGIAKSQNGDVTVDTLKSQGSTVAWITKTDKDGNLLWEKTLGGEEYDIFYDLIELPNGNLIAIGYTYSQTGDFGATKGLSDMVLASFTSDGNLNWTQTYGGSKIEFASSLISTSDNGFLLIGNSGSEDGDVSKNQGSLDAWIVKTDSLGNMEWETTIGGSGSEILRSVIPMENGDGYLLGGTTASTDGDVQFNNGDSDIWVVKIDDFGNLIWESTYGGSELEDIQQIIKAVDGGYIIIGSARSSDGMVSGYFGVDPDTGHRWGIAGYLK